MKKTVSFNLEEDIIEKIEQYQKKNNLSSRSAALERIILGLNTSESKVNMVDLKGIIKELIGEISITQNYSEENKANKLADIKNKNLDDTVNDIYGNME